MGTAQVEFAAEELLSSDEYAEPLIAEGIRCHGGFDADGTYRSPRTRFRGPAIKAWEHRRVEQFATPVLDVALHEWPETFPNVEQSRLLIRRGVPEPIISSLTRIGTVEGFGSMLRLLPLPDFESAFSEDIDGTTTAHIGRGLFEAHARDEAGFETEAGHSTMWWIARDIAFEHPVTDDQTAVMLERMGLSAAAGTAGPPDPEALERMRRAAEQARVLPADVDLVLEAVLTRMIGLLFIEISAFHTFRWAEELLSDTELVAGDGAAARLISHIRADETPHVDYLRTALSEMRDRTWVGSSGANYDGAEMMGLLWDRAIEESMVLRRADNLRLALTEIEVALAGRSDAADLLDELFTLGSVKRMSDGSLVDTDGAPTGQGARP